MELASKKMLACYSMVTLQDPPELIEDFIREWRAGYDVVWPPRKTRSLVVYGVWPINFSIVCLMPSYLKIPHDAGDFSPDR